MIRVDLLTWKIMGSSWSHSPRIASIMRDTAVLLLAIRTRSIMLILGTPVCHFFRTLVIGGLLKHSLLVVLRSVHYQSIMGFLTIGC